MHYSTTKRFTRDGNAALEKHLDWVCEQVKMNVEVLLPRTVMEGLVLTGPYGCGEGGVMKLVNDTPFDTMEFVVLVKGAAQVECADLRQILDDLAGRLTPFANTKLMIRMESKARLKKAPVSVDSYHFVTRLRWILGDESLLAGCQHHAEARRIPIEDAITLLLDSCSALLLARDRVYRPGFSIEDAAFVIRSMARAQMAMGDVMLIARQLYHWSCMERNHRLNEMRKPDWAWTVLGHHIQGMEFQLHPMFVAESQGVLAVRCQQVSELAGKVWLWLEKLRLNHDFASVRDYAYDESSKCPKESQWHNLVFNARAFGSAGVSSKWRLRHPLERLMRAMPLLLWDGAEGRNYSLVASCLDVLSSITSPVAAYECLWRRLKGTVLPA